MNNRLFLILFFEIVFVGAVISQNDKFADIATQQYDLRGKNLIQPQPIALPDINLSTSNQPKARFKPMKTISTKQELYAELETMRERYKPFMQDLAPKYDSKRQRIMLDEFKWRVANREDSTNFANTLQGQGEWENVTIPHFGPPLGRATTYYYKEIDLNQSLLDQDAMFLCFKGVDYKAHIFFNGSYCGSHEGFFAPFEFNVSRYAKLGKNILVVKVENDYPTTPWNDDKENRISGDKIYAATGPGYDEPIHGWHHGSPGMGIYQDCYLETRSLLHINDIFVRPLPDQSKAEAWVEVNCFEQYPTTTKLKISVFGQNFDGTVVSDLEYTPSTTIVPGIGDLAKPSDNMTKELQMMHGVNYLRIPIPMENFRYWETETPWLYQIQIKLYDADGKLSDIQSKQFGMRTFTMDTISVPKGNMYLNGKMIRLRGANTMGFEQQDVMKKDWDQLRDDMLLAKLSNMNFMRFTQRPVQDEVYDMCDKLGLLNQTDLPLFGSIRRNKFAEAVKQAEEMERKVRSHPSTIMVTYINERFPNAEGFPHRSLSSADEYYKLFTALDQAVLLSNPDRVIKSGDGDYDPPSPGLPDNHCYNLWYNGHGLGLGEMYKGYWQYVKPDWLYACGEFGAEALDPIETMLKYYPKEWLPKDKADEKRWNANRIAQAQTHKFHYMWYPTQHSIHDWIDASQDYQAWVVKFMSETFRRDPRMVSFAIHLFIDAWPGGWMKTIMDVDRQPKKAYFAYRDALEPLMTSIRSDRRHFWAGEEVPFELWISNDLNESYDNYSIHYQIEEGGKVLFSSKEKANIPINSAQFQGFFKYKTVDVKKRTSYVLRTSLVDGNGKHIHQNTFDFEVFPPESAIQQKIFVFGVKGEKATQLIEEANMTVVADMNTADVLLFDNVESYQKAQQEVDALVEGGKIALFLELPANQYLIANTNVKVEKTAMGNYYFVSPQSGHKIVKDFKPFDFQFWVNDRTNYISPLLANTMSGEGWTPILQSGSSNWIATGDPVMACAELKHGKGVFRVCEVQLNGMLKSNPTATIFFKKILEPTK